MLDFEDYQWARLALKQLEFFAHCSDEEILALVESLEKKQYKAGSTILRQGEISNQLYMVKTGTVGIWKSIAGEKKMVAELGADRYFGEISLMIPSSATATVKAQTDSEILSLTYDSLEFAFRKHPEALKDIEQKIHARKAAQSVPAQGQPPSPAPSQ